MEVILSKDVDNLGKVGTIVKVKEGYARNFLFPKKVAYPATKDNLKRIEQEKQKRQLKENELRKEAEELGHRLAKVSLSLAVEVNDLDKMYGSVTDVDILRELESEGFKLDKKVLLLEKPIEELGIYEVKVKLHHDVIVPVRVWVTKK